jgi:hypothetical protein
MSSFKQLLEYLQNPEELTGERRVSRSKRVMQLIRKRKDSNTSKKDVEKINRILGRMTGKPTDRYLSHPADYREMERRNKEYYDKLDKEN